MITDLFYKRYPQPLIFADDVPSTVHKFLGQAVHIIFDDLAKTLALDQTFFRSVQGTLARELGVGVLFDAKRPDEICGRFLLERYDLWRDAHGRPDGFIKLRLSLIELIFREAEKLERSSKPTTVWRRLIFRKGFNPSEVEYSAIRTAIDELNGRFREAGIPLHYHNGIIQLAQDELSQRHIAEPCWEILRDSMWSSAEAEMKEALDRADSGHTDAAFHAAKALESVIKIISDKKGWTTGAERGASSYIDNLVSKNNCKFIEAWEADALKQFFGKVRNPHGHGAGSSPPPKLGNAQITWAVENCMIWIKSLVSRL